MERQVAKGWSKLWLAKPELAKQQLHPSQGKALLMLRLGLQKGRLLAAFMRRRSKKYFMAPPRIASQMLAEQVFLPTPYSLGFFPSLRLAQLLQASIPYHTPLTAQHPPCAPRRRQRKKRRPAELGKGDWRSRWVAFLHYFFFFFFCFAFFLLFYIFFLILI